MLKILIVSSGASSTPNSSGDAITKVVYSLSLALSKNIKITIFDIWSDGYSKYEKVNENLDIIRVKIPNMFSSNKKFVIFGLYSAFYALFNDFKIIHCNNQWPLIFNWLIFRKTVYTSHSPYWGIKKQTGERISTKLASIPIAISQHVFQKMYEINKNVKYIHNGVNTTLFINNHLKNKNSILFVGKISERKGVKLLIKAYHELSEKYKTKNALNIVGPLTSEFDNQNVNYYQNLLTYIKKNKIKNVRFLNSKKEIELIKIYNESKIFVLPSLNEGMPLVLLESLSCGVPSISNNFLGIRSYFPKESGLITFNYNNSSDLKRKIENILELNQQKYLKLSKQGRTFVVKNYSWDLIAKEHIKLYSTLI